MARVAIRVTMTGEKDLLRQLRNVASASEDRGIRREARTALLGYGNDVILPKVQGRTPIKSGKLMRTERIRVMVSPKKEELRVAVCAGGPNALYARKVHDELKVKHKVGQARYIASVVLEAIPTAARDIASRMSLVRAARGA